MVDFQSRDTRRGPVTDEEDKNEEEPDEAAAETETAKEQQPASDEGREQADPLAEADSEPVAGDTETNPTESDSEPVERDAETETDEPEPTTAASDTTTAAVTAEGSETASDREPVAPARTIDVAVVTVGEASEGAVVEPFESAGHTIATRERLRGDYDGLQQSVDTLVSRDDVDVVVTTGGIGIGSGEVTIEAVHPLFEKALPGFGEAFRTLLYDVIGTGIVAVRSAAGVADGTLVFCLPADAEAAGLAVEEILATEAPELVAHLDS